jgi:hypothetical protein
MTFLLSSTILVLFCIQPNVVISFPTGAGGCAGNEAAVGGAHLTDDREVQGGPLDVGDIVVAMNGFILDPITTDSFPINTDIEITVEGNTVDYKGILIRMELPVDTVGTLIPSDAQLQLASVCIAPIVGITHVDSSDKAITTGIINIPQEVSGVILDITIVFINRVDLGSAYAYSRFLADFRDVNITVSPNVTVTDAPLAVTTTGSPTTLPVNTRPPTTIIGSVPSMVPTVSKDVTSPVQVSAPSSGPVSVSKSPTSMTSVPKNVSTSLPKAPTTSPSIVQEYPSVDPSCSISPTPSYDPGKFLDAQCC